jgi:putative ABC transport system substrate-binding protein
MCWLVLTSMLLTLLAAPLAAEAQRAGKVLRTGLVSTLSAELPQIRELSDAVRQGLRELGYVEGRNIVIEDRSAQGRLERLPELFAELARLKVDLIFILGGTPAAGGEAGERRDPDRRAGHG